MSEVTTDPYFGGCPECGGNDGYLNANQKDHWFICNTHRTKWYVGTNLFSAWQHLSDEELLRQARQLETYREAKPIHATGPQTTKPDTFIADFLGLDD